MKKLFIPLLFAVLSISSCDTLSKLTQFEKEITTTITIPVAATMIQTPITVPTPEIKTDISKYLLENKIDTSLIEKISLKKLQMTIISPDTCTFKFLSSIEVSIYTPDSTMVSKIASLTNVPTNKVIDLVVEDSDLKKFILKDAFKLSFKIASKEPIKSDYTVEVKPMFLLDVSILGL